MEEMGLIILICRKKLIINNFELLSIKKFFLKIFFNIFLFLIFFSNFLHASSGAFLAANSAVSKKDYSFALSYYDRLLKGKEVSENIFEEALIFSLISGNVSKAEDVSVLMEKEGIYTSLSSLILVSKLIVEKRYLEAKTLIDKNENNSPKIFFQVCKMWLDKILNVDMNEQSSKKDQSYSFSESINDYQKAIFYALKNDFVSSYSYFNLNLFAERNPSESEAIAWAQILSQNNENLKAKNFLKFYLKNFGDSYKIKKVILELEEDKLLNFSAFGTPWESISDVLFQLSSIDNKEKNSNFVDILYLRIVSNKGNNDIYFYTLGNKLRNFDLFDLSNIEFKKIEEESDFFYQSKLSVVDNFFSLDQIDNAHLELNELSEYGYDEYSIFELLGDVYRFKKDYLNATKNYTLAIDKIDDKTYPNLWFLYFVRGISYEQSGNWEKAEFDLEKSLEYRPNQPQVLNYLGYSLIEKKDDLEKALLLIKKALDVNPDEGYIIDSLAWCLYKLGRYKEAVFFMEKAVELEPTDPVVNDHLGDIFWKVGRKREAFFQWKRALLFKPDPKNIRQIEMKVQKGLIHD